MKKKPANTKEFIAKTASVITLGMMIIGALAFVAFLYYFGFLGAFQLLDVRYQSAAALVLFVGMYLLVGIIGDGMIKIADTLVKSITYRTFFQSLSFFVIACLVNLVIIRFLDALFTTIAFSESSQLLTALFIALTELAFTFKRETASE